MSLEVHGSDSRVAVVYSSLVRDVTRNAGCNLLTGGPVLGQREKAVKKFCGWPRCRAAGTAPKTASSRHSDAALKRALPARAPVFPIGHGGLQHGFRRFMQPTPAARAEI